MIEYRPFLNADPPLIAEIWRTHPPLRGIAQAVSPAVLERHLFSKPYFDRHGLILAMDGETPVGFVHAGFGPTDDLMSIRTEVGVTCMLMVPPHESRGEIMNQLLIESEKYLASRGSKTLFAGGIFPANPFYLGLYGGSRLPGILAEDRLSLALFKDHGYTELRQQLILQRKLHGFRPAVNRLQLQAKRRYHVQVTPDPKSESWWEACTLGQAERMRFDLVDRQSNERIGSVMFWDMEPLATTWGVHAMGMYDLAIEPSLQRQGLATYIVGEALRQLQTHGSTLSEVQASSNQMAAKALFAKLGFEQVDKGIVLTKNVG